MQPRVNYPAVQTTRATTVPTDTGSSQVQSIPRTAAGDKPAFVRIALSAGAAYVTPGPNTSVTAVTGSSIVTSGEALWLNTLAFGAVAFRQISGGPAVASISACEEGALRVPNDTSGLG